MYYNIFLFLCFVCAHVMHGMEINELYTFYQETTAFHEEQVKCYGDLLVKGQVLKLARDYFTQGNMAYQNLLIEQGFDLTSIQSIGDFDQLYATIRSNIDMLSEFYFYESALVPHKEFDFIIENAKKEFCNVKERYEGIKNKFFITIIKKEY